VEQLVVAFRTTPLTANDLKQQRFLRLPMLRRLMETGVVDSEIRSLQAANALPQSATVAR
jgi:hypothetical protein